MVEAPEQGNTASFESRCRNLPEPMCSKTLPLTTHYHRLLSVTSQRRLMQRFELCVGVVCAYGMMLQRDIPYLICSVKREEDSSVPDDCKGTLCSPLKTSFFQSPLVSMVLPALSVGPLLPCRLQPVQVGRVT